MEDDYTTGSESKKYMTQTFYVGGGDNDKNFRNAVDAINLKNGKIIQMCVSQSYGYIIYAVVV